MSDKYDPLKIENQICFPLYACSKELIRKYTPLLKKLELTYTQYITMLVLWEKKSVNVKTLGEYLFLDSGTLTPVLKKLESKGLLTRERCKEDERLLNVNITEKGLELRELAVDVPKEIQGCVDLDLEEKKELYKILYKMLEQL